MDTIVLDVKSKGAETAPRHPRQTFDTDNLIGACTQKLSADPYHEKALFIRASSFVKRGLYDEAISDCNKLVDLNQANPNAYYVRGTALERLGQVEKCLQDFSRVLDLDPSHVNAAYSRAAAENRRGNYFQAIADYNLAFKLDTRDSGEEGPQQKRALMQLGLEEGRPDEAPQSSIQKIQKMQQFKKMDRNKLLLSPSGGKLQTRVGFGSVTNDHDEALSEYQQTHKQNQRKDNNSVTKSAHNESMISSQQRGQTPVKNTQVNEMMA